MLIFKFHPNINAKVLLNLALSLHPCCQLWFYFIQNHIIITWHIISYYHVREIRIQFEHCLIQNSTTTTLVFASVV